MCEEGGEGDGQPVVGGQHLLLRAEVFAAVVRLVAVDALFPFAQLQGVQAAFPQPWSVVVASSDACRGVHYPLVACFRVQLQVQRHFVGVDFVFQGFHRLVVLHDFRCLHGFGAQVVVHLVIPSARHVHALHQKVVDGLALVLHLPALLHVHAGQPFQHVLDVHVFGGGELREVVSHGVLAPLHPSAPYLHLFQDDGRSVQSEVLPSGRRYVAYFPFVAQQRGAELQGVTVVSPRQRVVSFAVGQGIIYRFLPAHHAEHDGFQRLSAFGVGDGAAQGLGR